MSFEGLNDEAIGTLKILRTLARLKREDPLAYLETLRRRRAEGRYFELTEGGIVDKQLPKEKRSPSEIGLVRTRRFAAIFDPETEEAFEEELGYLQQLGVAP